MSWGGALKGQAAAGEALESPLALSQAPSQVGAPGCAALRCHCPFGFFHPFYTLPPGHRPPCCIHPPVPYLALQFVGGRPAVPKLQLSRLQEAQAQAPQWAPAAAAAAPAVPVLVEQAPKPVVPRLALSKLNPLAAAATQAAGGSGRPSSGRLLSRSAREAPAGELA